ncbi:hypothetical protein [Planctomycetes bacterium Poly30]|uniref:hypothetical protein n=1 Tax=Saltatorellus ferox TaxID=2528018 RepID=UPI0011A83638
MALADVYGNVGPAVQMEMELLFGGDPSQVPFEYQRSSLIEVDLAGGLIPGGRHMGLNLTHVPVRSYYHPNDPEQYLVRQTLALDTFMGALPGAPHELVGLPATTGCLHCWDTLNEWQACNWLAAQSLAPPPLQGEVLADRAGRWAWFDVEPGVSGEFTSFAYELDPSLNRLTTTGASNVDSVALELGPATLSAIAPIQWLTSAADGRTLEVSLPGFSQRPNAVVRNGAIVPEDCSTLFSGASWCYEPATQTLRLHEPDASATLWTVVP